MRRELLEMLVDPQSGDRLELRSNDAGAEISSGELRAPSGPSYPIADGIPRFVSIEDAGQQQTAETFGYKWTNEGSFGSEGMQSEIHSWVVKRYGFASTEAMRSYFGGRGLILDAGCGAGFATSAWMNDGWASNGAQWVGADISRAIDVAKKRLGRFPATHFVQADLTRLPFAPETFDTIFAEGVLHHTPSTEASFKSLVPLLKPQGEIMIYVYRTKSPVREFTDDYVRERIAGLPPDQAWAALRPLTALARSLAELDVEVEVTEDVPLLGISAGRYDVQRLIYWHMAKLFWNPKMTFEENTHVNFDWYHPQYAHRQSEEDVRRWFDEAGVEIRHFDVDEAGFTVRGVRR